MHQVKDERITEEELWKRFHHIPSVQVMIDSRRMKFLAKVARSQRLAPTRQMLIAYVDNPRPRGRPIISCKASMVESLQRFGKYNGLHIDDKGSLKFWYVEARNDPFWGNCLERFKRQDPDDKVPPERPAHPECSDEEEDHHRYNTRSSAQPPPPPPQSRTKMSNDEAKAFFQLFNNARDFLEKITSGEQDACKQQQETTTYDSTESYYQE
jgi:hypothetical protein